MLLQPFFGISPIGGGFVNKVRRQLFRLGLSDTERRLLVLPSFYHSGLSILKNVTRAEAPPLDRARQYLEKTRLQDPLNIYYYGLLKVFLPDDLLYKNERMASANGIINRTPFIDYRLVELAFKIPEKMKVKPPTRDDDGTKLVYKKAAQGLIPNAILNRKKGHGFSIPSSEWYRGVLRDQVNDCFRPANSQLYDFLEPRTVQFVKRQHENNTPGYGILFNSLVMLGMWLQQHKTPWA